MRSSPSLDPSLRVYETAKEASRAVARAFVDAAHQAVGERGRFVVALSGGGTPRRVYELLRSEHGRASFWPDAHFFWSDERFVPPDDAESNARMARDALLDLVPVPEGNLHTPLTTSVSPEEAARLYEQEIEAFFHPDRPRLDWTFLGLGEDGHVASLFPGSEALLHPGERLVLPVRTEAKPPPVRLTMTLPLLNASREIHFLVFGRGKREILRRALEPGDALPAQRVGSGTSRVVWWADREAAPWLPVLGGSNGPPRSRR